MMIDGKAIAEEMYSELSGFFKAHPAKLGLLVVGADAVIGSFVRIKTRGAQRLGVETVRIDLASDATTADVVDRTHKLAQESDAVIVQLPLPKHVDVNAVLSAIPAEKDVDALNPAVSENQRIVEAPVALAILEILERSHIGTAGKRAVVVGAGRLVGAPTAALLRRAGADVGMVTLEQGSLEDLKDADIVVLGAGNPGFIKPDMLKPGVALVDAGASEQKGKIRGDADSSCADAASIFTPVPGGVGPIAVAMIFRNLKLLTERNIRAA